MGIKRQIFGRTADETLVDLYTLATAQGMTVDITNYGATVVSLAVPDRNGQSGNVILGYDSLEEYVNGSNYFGCTVGRCANRMKPTDYLKLRDCQGLHQYFIAIFLCGIIVLL